MIPSLTDSIVVKATAIAAARERGRQARSTRASEAPMGGRFADTSYSGPWYRGPEWSNAPEYNRIWTR